MSLLGVKRKALLGTVNTLSLVNVIRLVSSPFCTLLLNRVADERRENRGEQVSENANQIAVQSGYSVKIRNLRNGDDQQNAVINPTVAESVEPERSRLFQSEKTSRQRFAPHRAQRAQQGFNLFFHKIPPKLPESFPARASPQSAPAQPKR